MFDERPVAVYTGAGMAAYGFALAGRLAHSRLLALGGSWYAPEGFTAAWLSVLAA